MASGQGEKERGRGRKGETHREAEREREGCLYAYAGTHRGQERASDPLQLESHVLVRCLHWVLGTEFGSSARAAIAPNC